MSWKVKRNDFPTMSANLREGMQAATRGAAMRIAGDWQKAAPGPESADFSTGEYRASIYALTDEFDGYDAAVQRMQDKNDEVADPFAEEGVDTDRVLPRYTLAPASRTSAHAAVVSASAHGIFVERGFFLGRPGFYFKGKFYPVKSPGHMVPARPVMNQSVDANANWYIGQLMRVLKSLERGNRNGALSGPRKERTRQADTGAVDWQAAEAAWREKELIAFNQEARKAGRQETRDRMDFLGARLSSKQLSPLRNSTNTRASGRGYFENFGEVAERLKEEYDRLKISDSLFHS